MSYVGVAVLLMSRRPPLPPVQVAAAYAVYGPRTVLVLARPRTAPPLAPGAAADAANLPSRSVVQEFVLREDGPVGGAAGATAAGAAAGSWLLSRDLTLAPSAKTFAPANLRASAGNAAYRCLVERWLDAKFTLRYTGAMVPDVHHMLVKGQGVFCNALSPQAPPKLRLLYEVLPLAFVVEAAGGGSTVDGGGSALAQRVGNSDARCGVCLGSREEVRNAGEAMAGGSALNA